MKMSSLIPCEFDNDLHEDLRKEDEFRQRQAEKKEREKQLAQEKEARNNQTFNEFLEVKNAKV